MLFKYTVSETPTTPEDFKQDVVKILTNQLNPDNLSDNCNAAQSGFVDGSTPINDGRAFEVVVAEGGDAIVKRKHSQFPTKDIFIDLKSYGTSKFRLACLGGYSEGSRIAPATGGTSSTFMQVVSFLTASHVLYIGVTDCAVFITSATGIYTNIHCELFELTETNGLFSYAGAPADCSFAVEVINENYLGAVNLPRGIGPVAHPSPVYRPQALKTQNEQLLSGLKSSAFTSTQMSSSNYPLPLPNGEMGLPLHKALCQPISSAFLRPQYTMGDIYQGQVTAIASILGQSIQNDEIGSLLVLTSGNSVGDNVVTNFYIPGV